MCGVLEALCGVQAGSSFQFGLIMDGMILFNALSWNGTYNRYHPVSQAKVRSHNGMPSLGNNKCLRARTRENQISQSAGATPAPQFCLKVVFCRYRVVFLTGALNMTFEVSSLSSISLPSLSSLSSWSSLSSFSSLCLLSSFCYCHHCQIVTIILITQFTAAMF